MTRTRTILGLLTVASLAALSAGCLQVETRVSLHPDGSATITERVRFSRDLLDLGTTDAALNVAPLLERSAVADRVAHMGQGLTLVSHEVRDAEGGSREALSVFRIDDINQFRYASPFLAFTDYPENSMVGVQMVPLLKSRNYAGSAGQMAVQFKLLKPGKGEARPRDGEPPPPGPAPSQVQIFRELAPVFRDMLHGFQVRLIFESYAPVAECGFAYRGFREGANWVDLICFSDQDLDKHGSRFLDNEEVMLDLVRGRIGSANVVDHCTGYRDNPTVPVFLPWGSAHAYWHQSDEICFKPSRELFDRYFAGKKLDYSRWAPGPPDTHVDADFEKIGYHPDKTPTTQPEAPDRGRTRSGASDRRAGG